jgi:hypothetical protein
MNNNDLSRQKRAMMLYRQLGYIEVKEAGKNYRLLAAVRAELLQWAEEEAQQQPRATVTNTPNPDSYDDGEHIVEDQTIEPEPLTVTRSWRRDSGWGGWSKAPTAHVPMNGARR